MSDSSVVQLINAMVEHGGLSREEASKRKVVEARYRGRLGALRFKLLEVVNLLGLDGLFDPYLWDCLKCIASLHDFDSYALMPEANATGGIKTYERCVRCFSHRNSIRNEFTDHIDRREYVPAQEGDDRDRYLTIYRSIERHQASLVLEVARWYRTMEAEARSKKVKIPEPLQVF